MISDNFKQQLVLVQCNYAHRCLEMSVKADFDIPSESGRFYPEFATALGEKLPSLLTPILKFLPDNLCPLNDLNSFRHSYYKQVSVNTD